MYVLIIVIMLRIVILLYFDQNTIHSLGCTSTKILFICDTSPEGKLSINGRFWTKITFSTIAGMLGLVLTALYFFNIIMLFEVLCMGLFMS